MPHYKLERGIVWCTQCGNSHRVNANFAFKTGWPKCCGYTMTIDSPSERRKLGNDRKNKTY